MLIVARGVGPGQRRAIWESSCDQRVVSWIGSGSGGVNPVHSSGSGTAIVSLKPLPWGKKHMMVTIITTSSLTYIRMLC